MPVQSWRCFARTMPTTIDVITIDRRDFAVHRTRTGRAFVKHFPKAT